MASLLDTLKMMKAGSAKRMLADDDDYDSYTPVGLDGVIAASEKLLAVNKGLEEADEKDALHNDRIYSTDALLAERIRMDKDQMRKKVMWHAARHRSLKGMSPFVFDGYGIGMIVGNQLSQPLEEINPLHIAEQARRVTKMGPGGIGDIQAITESAQSVHPSQFGFISPTEGPECFDDLSEVYTLRGWAMWPEVLDTDIFACRVNGVLAWHAAHRIVRQHYKGELILGEHETIRMAVTPNHRVIHARNISYREDTASDIFGKSIKIPITHKPYMGNPEWLRFTLPGIHKTDSNQKELGSFCIGDWCEFIGWWLSAGSATSMSPGGAPYGQPHILIHQDPVANPENHSRVLALLLRMGLRVKETEPGSDFCISSEQITAYLSQYTKGCHNKWIPEDLFEAPVWARERLLDALLRGDGRYTVKRHCYRTVSPNSAKSVERLAISLGYTAFIRYESGNRSRVKTTDHVVSIHRQKHRSITSNGNYWKKINYDGMVYCATVPGGLLHVRGKKSTSGFWSGNSGLAGIDVRLATGTKVGSDRRIYQRFRNSSTKKIHWMSPEDLLGASVKLPD